MRARLLAIAPPLAAFAVVASILAGAPARAQQVGGFVELIVAASSATTRSVGGQANEIDNLSLLQRYSFDVSWDLYPNLLLSVGGLYEQADTEDSGDQPLADTTRESLRSYLNLVYRTPLYYADAGFYRLEDSLNSQGDIRESLNLTLGWRPEDYPVWTARFLRTDSYDEARESRDITESLADLTGEWAPVDALRLYYRGGIREEDNRLEGTEIRSTTQVGRVTYGDSWWGRRLQLSAEYNANYFKQEVLRTGEGEVVTPQPSLTGLALSTEFPLEAVLESNPALTDGNRAASAGVDLGLPPPGGDDSPRNIGLDFGVPTTVDTLRVWVDRELPPEISSTFRWEIYSSSDNRLWQLEETLTTAPFGPLENRFELRFGEVTSRYVKVVTRPLDRVVPRADEFPLILITELEAFERTPPEELLDEPGTLTHRFSGSLRTKLLAGRNLFHDLSYSLIDPEDRPTSENLSNALSFSQRLGSRHTVSARAAREEGSEGERDFVSYPFSAAVRAVWLPTLQQSLVLSGTRNEIEGEISDFQSLFLQTSAELYHGVNVELGLGRSRSEAPDGERIDSTRVTASSTLVPHPKLSVNLIYLLRESDRQGGERPESPSSDLTAQEIGVGYRPFPALYLFAAYRLEQQPQRPDRTRGNYNLSWSPFPDGSLQLTFTYDEITRSELDSLSRNTSASARWNITRSRYLQISYRRFELGSLFENREQESLQVSLRLTF